MHVVAIVKILVIIFAGIPESRVDRTATVGQIDLQIKIATAIGPQLFVGARKT